MGQQSILHAVKVRRKSLPKPQNSFIDEEEENVKPLCETLTNVMFSNEQNNDEVVKNGQNLIYIVTN